MRQISILVVFLLIPLCTFGKGHRRYKMFHRHSRNDTSMIVRSYTDSLSAYKMRMDSLMAANDSLTQSQGMYFHLFTPLTFYHSAANRILSLEKDDSSQSGETSELYVDRILMDIYLRRPDLVLNSENQISKSGSLRQDMEHPLRQKVLLAEKTAPRAVEPTDVPMSIVVKRPNFWSFSGDYYLQLISTAQIGECDTMFQGIAIMPTVIESFHPIDKLQTCALIIVACCEFDSESILAILQFYLITFVESLVERDTPLIFMPCFHLLFSDKQLGEHHLRQSALGHLITRHYPVDTIDATQHHFTVCPRYQSPVVELVTLQSIRCVVIVQAIVERFYRTVSLHNDTTGTVTCRNPDVFVFVLSNTTD